MQKVPHRQIVLTIPKRLRKAFQFDRKLLTDLCRAAWLSLRDVIRIRLGTPTGQPGVIVAITRHIPIPGQHLVRYYGAYSNRARGERRKAPGDDPIPSAADTPLPTKCSYADFASEREAENHQRRAAAYDQGIPIDGHPDAVTPQVESATDSEIEIIELPRHAFPRIPRKKWRELIQKVWVPSLRQDRARSEPDQPTLSSAQTADV